MNKTQELAEILINKGMLPRYKSDGSLDPKGRTFRFELEDEILEAKKRDDVYPALEKCPKIQQYFLERLKNGDIEAVDYGNNDEDEFEDEDDFLKSLEDDEENSSEAEEVENGWDNI